MNTIVIGGGPAGMISAISASQNGDKVNLIERNDRLGKKLLITGKGRCNITSNLPMDSFFQNIPGNSKFLYSAFGQFTNQDIIDLLEKNGLKTKVERGNRIFPVTDKSQSVLDCLIKELKKNNVNITLNNRVKRILVEDGIAKGIELENGSKMFADKIILATGGKSYPLTGSTGDGYKMAQDLGHTITQIRPSIVPLVAEDKCKSLQGLSLRNISIKLVDESSKKTIYQDFGEMMFTHFGVSGPVILSSSAHLVRYKNIDEHFANNDIKLYIDLKPALSEEQLDSRILRDFSEEKNKAFKNSLNKLLPQKMIPFIVKYSNIDPDKQVNVITKEERKHLVQLLKNIEITIKGFRPIEEAIITAGGINVKEINPSTMESKLVKGLYFAGELIDVDAYTGGFNLQIAYSTGYLAGKGW